MLSAVSEHLDWCDVLVMTAAVADWRPQSVSAEKLKKDAGTCKLTLEPTDDILMAVRARKGARCFVGFAAESEDVIQNAASKLRNKKLDMIVANDITRTDSGFAVDNNQVTIIYADGKREELPLMSKRELAEMILERTLSRTGQRM